MSGRKPSLLQMTLSSLHFSLTPLRKRLSPFNPNYATQQQSLITIINPSSQFSINLQSPIHTSLNLPTSPSSNKFTLLHSKSNDDIDTISQEKKPHQSFIQHFLCIFPGSKWWDLPKPFNGQPIYGNHNPSSISVMSALVQIWELVADDPLVIFTAFASLTIAALSEVSIPSLLAACIFSAQNGETTVFFRNSQLLMILCLTSGVCSGLRACCFGFANMILVKRLRETLYSTYLFQDMPFFDTEAVGNLTSRLGADCQRLSRVIGNELHLIFRCILQGSGALINLLMLSRPLALSSLAICVILSAIFLVYGPYQKRAAKVMQDLEAGANEVSHEAFSLAKIVRICGTEKQEIMRYKQWLNKLTFVNVRESTAYGLWNLSFNILYRSTQVLAVIFGGISILSGKFSPEQLMKYILYCEWLIYATWRLVDNLASLQQSVGASERLFQLVSSLHCNKFSYKGRKLQCLNGAFKFSNVSFNYPSRKKVLALEHMNMSLQENEITAIVGLSGSGKSTLVKLLLRLYEPNEGEILVDGYPLKDMDVKWLREQIGYVGQEPRLFHMDIKSNITYGCLRDIKLEDVQWAAKLAGAHNFISSFPEGYHTIVRNDLLSGGQKQRIAMARAILRNPAILILDEATSAQDAESEYYIMELLHLLRVQCKTRTVILIAHRLSTVKMADRIFVMDSGKVVETGTHKELIQMKGLYAHLAALQGQILPQYE